MNRFTITFLFVVALVYGLPAHFANAAVLRISPASGSFEQGTTFTAGVYVSSPDQAMNAASGVLSFPIDMLQVLSLSKSGSIANLWVQEPAYSNFDGSVTFEGVVLNPGFRGTSGKLIEVQFRARRKIGKADFKFTSGSVLANDGKGTNILTGLEGASYVLKEVAPAPALPVPGESQPASPRGTPASSSAEEAAIASPKILLVAATTENARGPFRIEGQSDPGMKITVSIRGADELITLEAVTNESGRWRVDTGVLRGGTWQVSARATASDGRESEESEPVSLEVPSWFSTARRWLSEWGAVVSIAILLAGFIVGLLYFIVHRLQLTQLRFKKELWRFRAALHGDLKKLDRDLSAAKREGSTIDLTPGKLEKMRRGLKEEVAVIEKDVDEEMKTLEKMERE